MFAAWLMNLGRTVAAAVLNTGAGVQAQQTGSGSGTTAPAGGALDGGTWSASGAGSSEDGIPATASVTLATNGGVSASASLFGSTSVTDWYSPRTSGIGSSYWMEYSVSGTGGTISGGLVAGTRYALSASRSVGVSKAGVGDSERIFTISIYDAASGGTLLGTHTFTATVEVA